MIGTSKNLTKPPAGAQLDFSAFGDIAACWLCNERSGSQLWNAKGSNHATFVGVGTPPGPAWIQGGRFGGSVLSYNGTSNYNQTTFARTLGDFTHIVWFLHDGTGITYNRLADKNVSTGYWIGHNGAGGAGFPNSWGAGVKHTATPFAQFVTLLPNVWHQLVLRRNGAVCTVSSDGGNQSVTETTVATPLDSTQLRLGIDSASAANSYMKGFVDHHVIFPRALSDNDVARLYAEPFRFIWQPSATRYFRGASIPAVATGVPRQYMHQQRMRA